MGNALMQKKLAAYVTLDTPSRKEDGEVDKDSDYVGICINWVDREGKWHLKAWRERLGPTAIIEKMFGIYLFLIQAGTPANKVRMGRHGIHSRTRTDASARAENASNIPAAHVAQA
jgi:hypothetical protein